MKQLLAELPEYHRIVFCGESGFFVGALLELLDARGHGVLIKVKMKYLAQLLAQQDWTPIAGQPGSLG